MIEDSCISHLYNHFETTPQFNFVDVCFLTNYGIAIFVYFGAKGSSWGPPEYQVPSAAISIIVFIHIFLLWL